MDTAIGLSDSGAGKGRKAAGIKVCHVISSFLPHAGGAEIATWRLCRELSSRNVDVAVLTRRRRGLPAHERIGGVSVFRAGHASDSKLGSLTFVIHGLWVLGTRFRDYEVLHVQNLDAPLILGMLASKLFGFRLVATSHGQRRLTRNARARRAAIRIRLMRKLVHRFTALTPDMERQLRANGVDPCRIDLIPNGVDTGLFRPIPRLEKCRIRARLGLDGAAVVVLFVGRLIALKRVDLLIRAWASSRAAAQGILVIVGDGPEDGLLRQLAMQVDAADVRFEGKRDNVSMYLQAADVFVLPSEHEGLSVALLEAMATGVAALVTDLPGNRVLIRHAENGLIVPPGDADELRLELDRLARDPDLRRRFGRAAREGVISGHSLSAVAQRHENLYRQVCTVGGLSREETLRASAANRQHSRPVWQGAPEIDQR